MPFVQSCKFATPSHPSLPHRILHYAIASNPTSSHNILSYPTSTHNTLPTLPKGGGGDRKDGTGWGKFRASITGGKIDYRAKGGGVRTAFSYEKRLGHKSKAKG